MHKTTHPLAALALTVALSLMGLAASSRALPAQDSDITRVELGHFDQFLDNHPDIAQDLTKDPSLINNMNYVESHPALQAFLEDHPQIRQSFQANPRAFMRGVARVDAVEEARADLPGRGQIITLDNFLDNHPALAKQLEANPSLVNNQDFMKANPDLAAFLNNHPELAEDLRAHPNVVLNAVARFDVLESERSEINVAQVATLDKFLDDHQVLAGQLEANPSLIDNQDFMKSNPDLVAFLKNHPELAEELRAHPSAVLNAVARFDMVESERTGGRAAQVATFAEFLDDHPTIAAEVEAHPSLAASVDFIDAHPELKTFLENHPGIRDDLQDNSRVFMNQVRHFDRHETSKIEQHEAWNHK
ncbi:MAG TPA: hypothetical protein VI455_04005 [Terriglobia bacterium]